MLLAGLLLVVGLVWDTLVAQAQAAVALGSFLEAPVVTPVVRAVTSEPRAADEQVAGRPAFVAHPGGDGPHPAIFFVNGAVSEGRDHPDARRLALSFARAGYLVVLPDLPGLRELELRPETVAAATEITLEVAARSDVRGGTVALIGVSTGGSLALLVAEQPEVRAHVSVVAGIAPYADIKTVLSLATTGHYQRDGGYHPYPPDSYLPYVAGRSLKAAVADPEDRRALQERLRWLDSTDADTFASLRALPEDRLGPEARAVRRLLVNRDPRRFDDLYAALPARIRNHLEALSPLAGVERLTAPVELVTGPRDKYFPASESYYVKHMAPARRVTITDVLDHAEIRLSGRDVWGFAQLNAFAVRSLRAAG